MDIPYSVASRVLYLVLFSCLATIAKLEQIFYFLYCKVHVLVIQVHFRVIGFVL